MFASSRSLRLPLTAVVALSCITSALVARAADATPDAGPTASVLTSVAGSFTGDDWRDGKLDVAHTPPNGGTDILSQPTRGTDPAATLGDGGLGTVYDVAAAPDGSVYIAALSTFLKRAPDGTVTTIQGGFGATSAVTVDADGHYAYLANFDHGAGIDGEVIRYDLTASDIASTATVVAGGVYCSNYTRPPFPAIQQRAATSGCMELVMGLALHGNTLYIVDDGDSVIDAVNLTSGTITTLAGSPNTGAAEPTDGALGTTSATNFPVGAAVDADGNFFFADGAGTARSVWMLTSADGTLHRVAGGGAGDVAATSDPIGLHLSRPTDLAVDTEGNLYVIDTEPNSGTAYILKVTGVAAPVRPTAVIDSDAADGEVPLTVHFTADTTPAPGTTSPIVSYAWSDNDAADSWTSTDASPTHTFSTPGDYTVTLTVTDGRGVASKPATYTVNARVPGPHVTGVCPTAGTTKGDDQITISGSRLSSDTVIRFDGVAAQTMLVSPDGTSLQAITPPHVAGNVAVTVDNGTGGGSFDYGTFVPHLDSVTPDTALHVSATNGSLAPVTVTGSNLFSMSNLSLIQESQSRSVKFGDQYTSEFAQVACDGTSFTVNPPDQPDLSVSHELVTVTNPDGTSNGVDFTRTDPFTEGPAATAGGYDPILSQQLTSRADLDDESFTYTSPDGKTTVTIKVPAGTLPQGTRLDVYKGDATTLQGALPEGSTFANGYAVSWSLLNGDGSVSHPVPAQPIEIRVEDPSIKPTQTPYAGIDDASLQAMSLTVIVPPGINTLAVVDSNLHVVTKMSVTPGQIVWGSQVIAAGGGNVIAAGGGNLAFGIGFAIAAGGGNVIAAGGGNVIAAGGGNVIAAGGGNVIAAGGGNVIAPGGGNLLPPMVGMLDHGVSDSFMPTDPQFVLAEPPAAPGAPTDLQATSTNRDVTLSWSAPTDSGGAPISGYRVQVNEDGQPGPAMTYDDTSTTQTLTDLDLGHSYTFTVSAFNGGYGPASAGSEPITPAPVPAAAPTDVTATPIGKTTATVSWVAPTDQGGAPITGYTVQVIDGGGLDGSAPADPVNVSFDTTDTTQTITNLSPGHSYLFTVAAANGSAGETSTPSNPIITGTVPSTVTALQATPGNAKVDLSWTGPDDDGGIALNNYFVYRSTTPGGPYTKITTDPDSLPTGTHYTDDAVTNGTPYYYVVTAENALGESVQSAEASATPMTVPTAPTINNVTAGNGAATVTFDPPASDGGSAVTGYTVVAVPGNGSQTIRQTGVTGSPYTLNGLANGVTYTVTVIATNQVGDSDASAARTVTPAAPYVPTPPQLGPSGLLDVASATSTSGDSTATSTSTSPVGHITATAHGLGTITVGRYDGQPASTGAVTFAGTGTFADVFAAAGSTFRAVDITDCELGDGGTRLFWWDSSANSWKPVVPQHFDAGPPACVTATLDDKSSPTVAQLTGTVFAAAKPAAVRVSGVTPARLAPDSTATVTITGIGFTPGSVVRFGARSAMVATGPATVTADGSSLTVPVSVGARAVPGPVPVSVANPDSGWGACGTCMAVAGSPRIHVHRLRPVTHGRHTRLHYRGVERGGRITSYEVAVTRADASGDTSGWTVTKTDRRSAVLWLSGAEATCASVRAFDDLGQATGWSTVRCTSRSRHIARAVTAPPPPGQ